MIYILRVTLLVFSFSFSCLAKPLTPRWLKTTVMNGLNVNPVIRNGISVSKNVRLYSKNSYNHLRLLKTGHVDGLGLITDPDAQLVLESAGFGGQVRIKSVDNTRFLCVADHGAFIIKNKKESKIDHCIFIQVHVKGYTAYQSKINKTWYLGIKNDGTLKSAKKTGLTQRATHFIEI